MGDYVADNNTMNRQKVFGEFDSLLDPCPDYYSEQDLKIIANAIRQFNTSVFDAGCGDGRIFRHLGIDAKRYYGVDPSKRAISSFRENNPGMFQRVSTRPFEEMTDKWSSSECVVVATFGSASYFMTQYLELLAKSNKPHFLMFFKENGLPAVLGQTHIFQRNIAQLKRLFPFSLVYERGDYIIVSSLDVDWAKAQGASLIQPSLFD
jgi:SAM-dependent methyltransferase